MLRRLTAACLILAVFAAALPAAGQSAATCDTNDISQEVAGYAEEIAGATVDEVTAIRDEIDALLAAYLAQCPEEVTATETPATVEGALFTVVTTGNLNIRSCGNTSCAVVRSSSGGEVYSVLAQDGDWYEIDLGGGQTGFIAAWLTTRVPDAMIDVYEGYADGELVCEIRAEASTGGESGLDIAISNDGRSVVAVDILRPNTATPEPVLAQALRRFADTGTPYIQQTYRSRQWSAGAYQLHVDRDGVKKVFGFNLNQANATTIFVACY